tara:strand:+ start:17819 stop:20851 length:3033 start_codon:yes stop_codon:yes gene_type:complete
MDVNNKTTDEALDQGEIIYNDEYRSLATKLPKENFKEFDVYIDWETGTKHTMGIDDNDMPHLVSSEPVNLIDKGKKAISDSVETQIEVNEGILEANQKMFEGAKNFFVRAPKDYWKSITRAALKMNDAAIQGADFLTNGNYSLFNKSVTGETYYRNDDLNMTLRMEGEVLKDGTFRNTATDAMYMNGGQFSAFDVNGNLREGWKEISLPLKRLYDGDLQYEDNSFGMPVLMEYGVQYGVPGVQMYKLLGKAPFLANWGKVILAELGTEFVASTQHEEDVNMANMIISFGYGEDFDKEHNVDNSAQIILRELLDAVAADTDDTVFERKVKNALGNAPIGAGFAAVLKVFQLMKGFNHNKEGREILANELGLKISGDTGNSGTFKLLDADDNPIAAFPTKEEADEAASILGKGYKVQEVKAVGAAVNTEIPLKKDTPDFYSNVVNAINTLNISEKGMPGNQILATIKNTQGVKQIEIDDMGLEEFLKDKPNVTKTELDEFLEKKSLTERVNTTVLGETRNNFDELGDELLEIQRQIDIEVAKPFGERNAELINKLIQKEADLKLKIKEGTTKTFYKDQVLPGGENYKEMLISSSGNAQIYTKHHFEGAGVVPKGENLLAHVRFNERTINGKKTLFIEEIQSDLHQAGRKEGYATEPISINSIDNIGKIPDAPFKKNWHELAMKRIMKYAVDNDFDAISFTPASVQNKRYSLSSYTDAINVTYLYKANKTGDDIYTIQGQAKNGQEININVKADDLEAHVGKDLSEKILKDKDQMQLSEADEIKLENLKDKHREISKKINTNLVSRHKFANVNPDKKVYPHATRNFYYKNEAPGLTVYYSYQTPIHYVFADATGEVTTVTRVNDWGVTTGRHMSWANSAAPDDRIPGWRFEEKLNEIRLKNSTGSKETYNLIEKQDKLSKEIELLNNKKFKKYSGKDLEIGGTGMKGFYDKILPSFINKYLKKYGSKLSMEDLDGIEIPFFEIPESMKLDISEKGVPIAKVKQNKEMTSTRMA